MVDINKLNVGLVSDEVEKIFDDHKFPPIECPYCFGELNAVVGKLFEGSGTMLSLTCDCERWTMLEQAIGIEELEETANTPKEPN